MDGVSRCHKQCCGHGRKLQRLAEDGSRNVDKVACQKFSNCFVAGLRQHEL